MHLRGHQIPQAMRDKEPTYGGSEEVLVGGDGELPSSVKSFDVGYERLVGFVAREPESIYTRSEQKPCVAELLQLTHASRLLGSAAP